MQPEPPRDLCRRVVNHLSSNQRQSHSTSDPATVCQGMQRDVWIDYIADSGDCSNCSSVVANMLFSQYSLPDVRTGTHIVAPRGDILIFGGDTACTLNPAPCFELLSRFCLLKRAQTL